MSADGGHLESWPPKDHSWHVCFKLTYWFQRKRLLNIFSIVKTKSSHDGLLDISDRQTIHKFSTGPPNDHSCKVTIQLALWFWWEDLKNFSQWEHIMDRGSHVGFQISTKNKNLVEDHSMNISGKFGSILISGFREDLNVKS